MADDKRADAKEWTSFADKDLDVAVHLFETFRPMPLEIICFHCQQAAEKAVKSVIVLKGSQGGFPRKHDLFLLLGQIKNMASRMSAGQSIHVRYTRSLTLPAGDKSLPRAAFLVIESSSLYQLW